MRKDKEIILIGGGGHCKSVIDVIESEDKFKIVGIIDIKEKVGTKIFNYEIIGTDYDLTKIAKKIKFTLITIGYINQANLQKRKAIFYRLKKLGFILPVIISPFSYVSKYATINEGSVIMHQALVNSNAKVGRNCIINTKALIEHDAIIRDHCHISTGAIINGGVIVKEGTFVGSNATSKQNIEIERFIKAGEVVK